MRGAVLSETLLNLLALHQYLDDRSEEELTGVLDSDRAFEVDQGGGDPLVDISVESQIGLCYPSRGE